MVWTVHDSAARTQLSGFDTPLASLAFGKDGLLAAAGINGEIWTWRTGRCPEIGPAVPSPAVELAAPASGPLEPRRGDGPGSDGNRRGGGGRPRGEGQRPGGRGGFPGFQPTAIAFDSLGRLVVHDYQGLRISSSGVGSALGQAKFSVAGSLTQGPGTFRTTALAKSSDGAIMLLVRGSSLFLWRADAPDTLIPIDMSPQFASEAAPPPRDERGPGNNLRGRPQGGPEPRGPQLRSVQITPKGDRLFTVDQRGRENILRAWKIDLAPNAKSARASELRSTTLEQSNKVALKPDGTMLACVGPSHVTLFDPQSLRPISVLTEPGRSAENLFLSTMAFSPDGRSLAVGSSQGTISLWSLEVPTSPQLKLHLPGHRGWVSELAYDPQGHRLASATWMDSVVEVWDLAVVETELVRLKLAD
jgi:WD40 repeat protein